MSEQNLSVARAIEIAKATTLEGDARVLLTRLHNAAIILAGELESRHINWQPIETAPRDRPVLLRHIPCEGCPVQASAIEGEWCPGDRKWKAAIGSMDNLHPTHWCELEVPSDE